MIFCRVSADIFRYNQEYSVLKSIQPAFLCPIMLLQQNTIRTFIRRLQYVLLFSIEPHSSISQRSYIHEPVYLFTSISFPGSGRTTFNYSVDEALVYVRSLITSHDGLDWQYTVLWIYKCWQKSFKVKFFAQNFHKISFKRHVYKLKSFCDTLGKVHFLSD